MNAVTRPDELPAAFQSAWNDHDMAALGALFTDDATFVNRFGHYVRGVEEIVAVHRSIHQTIYRDSTLDTTLIAVDSISEGAAIVHFWCRLVTGVAHPAGPHTIDTLILAVVTKRDEVWRIKAGENVTLVDPGTGQPVLRA